MLDFSEIKDVLSWGEEFLYPPHPIKLPSKKHLKEMDKLDQYSAEVKLNDTRLVLIKNKNKFLFYNRRGSVLNYQPDPALLTSLRKMNIPNQTVLDGGLLHSKHRDIKHRIVLWDVLVYQGEIQANKNYENRRKLLEGITSLKTYRSSKPEKVLDWLVFSLASKSVFLSPQVRNLNASKVIEFFDFICKSDKALFNNTSKTYLLEGLVLKDLKSKLIVSRYRTPKDSSMLKLRRPTKNFTF